MANFQIVTGKPFQCVCQQCGQRLLVGRDKVFADLDGTPFAAYACGACTGDPRDRLPVGDPPVDPL
jgi:hypothetical protein